MDNNRTNIQAPPTRTEPVRNMPEQENALRNQSPSRRMVVVSDEAPQTRGVVQETEHKIDKGEYFVMMSIAIFIDLVQLPLEFFVTVGTIINRIIWVLAMIGFGVWLAARGVNIIGSAQAGRQIGNMIFGGILGGFYPEFTLLIFMAGREKKGEAFIKINPTKAVRNIKRGYTRIRS